MSVKARPLLVLAALAAATSPDLGKASLDDVKGKIRERFAADPMGSVVTTVLDRPERMNALFAGSTVVRER